MDEDVRFAIYDMTMREGAPPSAARVAEHTGKSRDETLAAFRRLADARMIVLQPRGEILMAGPFSAVATPFLVTTSTFSAYGNCIWDALGIPAMIGADASIDTNCADCGERVKIDVVNDEVHGSGFMHFVVPARLWWTHIVYT